MTRSSGPEGFKKHLIPEAKALEKGKMKEVQVEIEPGKKKAILVMRVRGERGSDDRRSRTRRTHTRPARPLQTSKGKFRATGAKCT